MLNFKYHVNASKYTPESFERIEIEMNDIALAWNKCKSLRENGYNAFIQKNLGDGWWTGIPDTEIKNLILANEKQSMNPGFWDENTDLE